MTKPLNQYNVLRGLYDNLKFFQYLLDQPTTKVCNDGIYSDDTIGYMHFQNCHGNLKRFRDAYESGKCPQPENLSELETLDYAFLNEISADLWDLSTDVFDDTNPKRQSDDHKMVAKPRDMTRFIKTVVILGLVLSQVQKARNLNWETYSNNHK